MLYIESVKFSILIFQVFLTPSTFGWDYSNGVYGPLSWKEEYSTCDGPSQSPIKLAFENLKMIVDYDPENNEEMLTYSNYDKEIDNAVIRNTGYSVEIDIPNEINISMTATFLPVTYILGKILFRLESEHTVGDTHYPLEVQFVHYDIDDAEMIGDRSVAIVSVFFQTLVEEEIEHNEVVDDQGEQETVEQTEKKRKRRKRHEAAAADTTEGSATVEDEKKWNENVLDIISNSLYSIQHYGQTETMFAFDIDHLLPKDHESIIHYRGSMTYPPCQEVVDWLIFTNVGIMKEYHLEAFKNISLNYSNPSIGSSGNFRPTQNLNGRHLELRSTKIADIQSGATSMSNDSRFLLTIFAAIAYRFCFY